MQSPKLDFQLSDADELVVRTYACMRIQPWFSPAMLGYLTVTNKRVVFHSSGKCLSGQALLISEMPIDDVAGLSTYHGLSFNWVLFLLFALLVYLATSLVASTPLRPLLAYEFAAILLLPILAIRLLAGNVLSDQAREQIFRTAGSLLQNRPLHAQDVGRFIPYARFLAHTALAIIAWRIVRDSPFGIGLAAWLLLFAIYGFVFLSIFRHQQAFSLVIGSRTTKGSGITIPGNSLNQLSLQSVAWASPAEDASQAIRELGALIMDIQLLGNLAVRKWQS